MHSKSKVQSLFIITILLAAAAGGYFASNYFYKGKNKANYHSLKLYPSSKAFSGFSLTDVNNNTLDENYFNGKWTLLFFGFTNCPDVCPTTLSELKKTFHLLTTENKIAQMPKVLFVSVDPERDTPEHLKEYIAFFNPRFNAASSNKANILSLASQIGVAYHIQEHETGNNNYSVDHTAAIFIIAPNKELYGIFRSPHIAKNIADDLTQLIGHN